MSDDEFIYDDDDDWFWYEEDNMGLGDELAEHAVHSPIMVEDPSLETVDTYSDWDYYSDDYYDDDPTIIAKQKTNGEPRKKRRKLSSTENIPNLTLDSSIVAPSTPVADSFKGVLWRLPVKTDDKVELYEPGKGEQISLLSDWRKLFKTSVHNSNGARAGNNGMDGDGKREVNAVSAKLPERPVLEKGMDRDYGNYSPPPLAIEDLDKTISRQREKLSQPDLQVESENVPAEMSIVADSEDEEELEDTTIAVPDIDAVDDDKEDEIISEKEDQKLHQPSIRVEIPTLAAVMKEDMLDQNASPRKRGRPKTVTTKETPANGKDIANSTATSTPAKRGRKRALETDKEDEVSLENNNRRSKRVASSAITKSTKATKGSESGKKRTRASSMASSIEERGKKKRT